MATQVTTTTQPKGLANDDAIRERGRHDRRAYRFDREATHPGRELHDTPRWAYTVQRGRALLTVATTTHTQQDGVNST